VGSPEVIVIKGRVDGGSDLGGGWTECTGGVLVSTPTRMNLS
jgi:hypothetical protein